MNKFLSNWDRVLGAITFGFLAWFLLSVSFMAGVAAGCYTAILVVRILRDNPNAFSEALTDFKQVAEDTASNISKDTVAKTVKPSALSAEGKRQLG